VDGDDLIPWKVDLPLNEESKRSLKSFKTDLSKSLFSLESLKDIFGSTPANDRLHVVILPSESSVTIATHSSTNCSIIIRSSPQLLDLRSRP